MTLRAVDVLINKVFFLDHGHEDDEAVLLMKKVDLTSTSSRRCVFSNTFLHFSCFKEGAEWRIYDRRVS